MRKPAETMYFKRIMYHTMVAVVRFQDNQMYKIEYNLDDECSARVENIRFTGIRNSVLHDWIKDSQRRVEDTEIITITQEEFMKELIQAQEKLSAIAA